MKRTALVMLAVFAASPLMAQDKAKPATTDKKPATTAVAKKGEKPAASPGWVIIEEDWWYPFRYDFTNSLHNARVHYRASEEEAAAAELDKAGSWLHYAMSHADKSTQEELSTARTDLMDFAMMLRSGKPIEAKRLDAAFAHASAALSKYHHFKANDALARNDLKTAGRHMMSAADHLRFAARSANHEYGSEVVSIFEKHAPHGYWDETIEYTSSSLGKNLTAIENELMKLGQKLKTGR